MTSGHLIFIPAVLIIGIFLGFLLGTRAAADRMNLERKREEERAKAREERAARKKTREKVARGVAAPAGTEKRASAASAASASKTAAASAASTASAGSEKRERS